MPQKHSKSNPKPQMETLPPDIILVLFDLLDNSKDFAALTRVNAHILKIADQDRVWQKYFKCFETLPKHIDAVYKSDILKTLKATTQNCKIQFLEFKKEMMSCLIVFQDLINSYYGYTGLGVCYFVSRDKYLRYEYHDHWEDKKNPDTNKYDEDHTITKKFFWVPYKSKLKNMIFSRWKSIEKTKKTRKSFIKRRALVYNTILKYLHESKNLVYTQDDFELIADAMTQRYIKERWYGGYAFDGEYILEQLSLISPNYLKKLFLEHPDIHQVRIQQIYPD